MVYFFDTVMTTGASEQMTAVNCHLLSSSGWAAPDHWLYFTK